MSRLYSHFFTALLKLKAKIKNNSQYEYYEIFAKEQWLPQKKLEKIQLERLNKLIAHAITKSNYYREKLENIKNKTHGLSSLEELATLPLLKRSDLQSNYKEILAPIDDTLYADSSGGSTGNPVNFFHDNNYKMFGQGLHLLFLSWLNIQEGDKTIVFWGADRDFGSMSLKEKIYRKLERIKSLNSFNVDMASLDSFLGETEKFKPSYIVGYASSLEQAAKRINETKEYNIRPRAIRSAAEMLYSHQREEIEKAFKAKVCNFYGSREINNLAAECDEHNGLHIFSSGRIIEIVDDHGNCLPDGETGRIIVTDLSNFSFPFIRYEIGDIGAINNEPCSCGRSYPLLNEISGRASDILTFGGKYIHGEFFTHLFYGQTSVKQFQVVQESENLLRIKIKTDNKEIDLSAFFLPIKEKIGESVEIKIEIVDEIPTLKSGKFRFTV